MQEIWTEKYRPKTLEEVVGQEEIVKRLKSYVKIKNMPHLLFVGPAGTGKTTCAIALAREMYGEELWRQNFQELNASDERGIQIVRTKIKDFARTAPFGEARFKILFLDEADALTADAQAALRRTMERYSSTCRFILSCNYSSKIIDPIQSRCAVFRFTKLRAEDVKKLMLRIAEKEGLEITDDALDTLLYISEGDMRKAINTLQVAASFSNKIDPEVLYKSTSTARPEEVRKLLTDAAEGRFVDARNTLSEIFNTYGMGGEDLIKQLHREIYRMTFPDDMKVKIIEALSECEYRIVEGGSERIQLEAFLARLSYLSGGKIG
ncbi:Replication factor C small subunit [Thermoplasmatales archaeon ex4484_36]|nr:MAG: Replication factor C small subunit [Thermoplasmatales archaeon ex4484_36]RLF56227.1 MAG: replication factor C small subunit [Thermoplasmata archaeon]RLF71064.1 MAG: replication factor C small subunit [Thermoplasmata archaeon]